MYFTVAVCHGFPCILQQQCVCHGFSCILRQQCVWVCHAFHVFYSSSVSWFYMYFTAAVCHGFPCILQRQCVLWFYIHVFTAAVYHGFPCVFQQQCVCHGFPCILQQQCACVCIMLQDSIRNSKMTL